MRAAHFAALLCVISSNLPAQDKDTSHTAPGARPDSAAVVEEANVVYGSIAGTELHLDAYEPGGVADRRPAVILIHGGGWTSFDKSTMRSMGEMLARNGFVAFSVDYRLFDGTHNRWPAQLDDVERAVRWVRANATKYHVASEHIGAFGHSAGAQLAALLGMVDTGGQTNDSPSDTSSRVQAVVDVSGPTDFTIHRDSAADFFNRFFGVAYAVEPQLWRDASPALRASRGDAPFLIMHGTSDPDVPLSQAEELRDRLQAAGVHVSLVTVDDVHTFRTPQARFRLAIETLAFFHQYLGSSQ